MIKLPDYHKSPKVLHIGCEAPRAYFIPYEDEQKAELPRSESKYFHSLCGEWDFKYLLHVFLLLSIDIGKNKTSLSINFLANDSK